MNGTIKAVFDCNTMLQALASPAGPAGACVQMAFDGAIRLSISPLVLAELRDVSARPKVIAKLQLTAGRVEEFLEAIQLAATIEVDFPEQFSYARDPDDAHYVNLALAAGAKFIISRDKDLLALMDASLPEGRDFQARFPALRILDPVQFLSALKA